MTKMNERGVTLVEIIVTGLLTAVLAGAGFTMFMMYTNETREVSAYMRMQRQYETLFEDIAGTARRATLIISTDESPTGFTSSQKQTREILMYSGTNVIGGYRFVDDAVEELKGFSGTTPQWKPFTTDGEQVLVDASNCVFRLSPLRKQLEISAVIRTVDKDAFYLKSRKGLFLCRI
ncbi:MAG: hypothetical protein ACOCXC_03405 [Fibrobacterota bacterium]